MKIVDKVYGVVEVNEAVIAELVGSKPLQRIKGLNQAGSQLIQTEVTHTRYDHCVGVMLLLRHFGASLEEQIAGLLHDVPHTAFSHTADFVFGSKDQTYHEKFLKKIVFESEIPGVLANHNIDAHFVTDDANFSLLEQPIPALCADRIDYFLRDLLEWHRPSAEIESYLQSLTTFRGVFVFNNQATAKKFGLAFMKQCREVWNGPKTLLAFELTAKAIKQGLDKKILTEDDLFETDHFVIEKLAKNADRQLQETLDLLTPEIKFVEDPANFDLHSRGKLRYVDPAVLIDGHTTILSELDPDYAEEIEKHALSVQRGHFLKIIS